ncbi:MAG: transglutaminase-like domain-containing protein [Clostridia bacterium]|nr:transglutaminase-like domain-containing protein [Clostridia bacterium]
MPDPKPERPDVNDYLECSDIIDFDHPLVEEASEQLTSGLRDTLSKVQAIYDFVTEQIFHSFQINATSVTLKASEVLDKGHGICYAKAHLFAALARASGIPAGLCYQIKYDEELEKLVVHGFNAVYLRELSRWLRLDASKHLDEADTRLDPLKEAPLLAVNKQLGEHDDPTIYVAPSRRIIKALNASETVDELRALLPSKI